MTNIQIIFLFTILLILAITSALCNLSFQNGDIKYHWYLSGESGSEDNSFAQRLKDFGTFLVLYNNLIPISLIVTMEVVRVIQAQLIGSDMDLYDDESDTPAKARTSSLVEELGQVEYIFSDKTGTLTCNKMVLKQCMIGGRVYLDKLGDGQMRANPEKVDEKGFEVGFYDFKDIANNLRSHPTQNVMLEYLTMLAVCHTVIPETDEKTPSKIIYQASSPDEGALVNGAAQLGFRFTIRRPRSITIQVYGKDFEYEILNVLEFNSTRKRMSVITRTPDGKIVLYCKGADTVILERLTKDNNPFVDKTLELLEECATEGLRTLCLARREIPEEEYKNWNEIYNKAATTVNNRLDELDKAAEIIEKDMFLLGATAIEDKLQDGVPETIHVLAQAGIKIWVLTGDRQETAINIGYSCKLLNEDMNLIVINEKTHFETKEVLENRLQSVRESLSPANNSDNEVRKNL
jgi:phospholipid-transporting ATPase